MAILTSYQSKGSRKICPSFGHVTILNDLCDVPALLPCHMAQNGENAEASQKTGSTVHNADYPSIPK